MIFFACIRRKAACMCPAPSIAESHGIELSTQWKKSITFREVLNSESWSEESFTHYQLCSYHSMYTHKLHWTRCMLSGVFCCIIQTSHAFVALFLRERVLVSSTRPLCTWKEGVTHCPQEHCSPAQLNDPSRALHFGHSSCAGRKNAFTLIICIKMHAYLLASCTSYPSACCW